MKAYKAHKRLTQETNLSKSRSRSRFWISPRHLSCLAYL